MTKASKSQQLRTDRWLGLAALVLIAIAWFLGNQRTEEEMLEQIQSLFEINGSILEMDQGLYKVYPRDTLEGQEYYLSLGSGKGYGGQLQTISRISLNGDLLEVKTLWQNETKSFFSKIERQGFIASFNGQKDCDIVYRNHSISAITGATLTSEAVYNSVEEACRKTILIGNSCTLPEEQKASVSLKFLDLWLIFFAILAWLGTQKWMPYKKSIRWISMGLAFIVLGFIYNYPLTIIQVNRSLLGSFPDPIENLSFYILFLSFFGFLILSGKNLYCDRMCPFVGLQEGLGKLGGARPRFKSARLWMIWFQRILILTTILIAIYLRKPSISSYEVYGAFFKLSGSTIVFILLGIILISSMFILKPWCSYLCPIRPVGDLVRLIRNWGFK